MNSLWETSDNRAVWQTEIPDLQEWSHPIEGEQWIMYREDFLVYGLPKQHKVQLSVFMFQGEAEQWWMPTKNLL